MFDFLNLFNLYTTPPFFSAVFFLLLGVFVLVKSREKKIGLSFFILCFLTFWWQFSWFILFNTTSTTLAAILVKIGYSGIIFLPLGLLLFFLSFVKKRQRLDKIFIFIALFISLFFVVSLWSTSLFVSGFFTYFWGFYPKVGVLHVAYLIFMVAVFARIYIVLLLMLFKRGKISAKLHYQIKYLLIALIFYNFAALDFLSNYGLQLYPFGVVFILIFLIIVGYTIIAHQFLGIQVTIRKSVVYFFSVWTLIIEICFAQTALKIIPSDFEYLSIILISVLSVFSFAYIKRFYYFLANKFFFYSLYDEKKIVSMVNEKVISTLGISEVNQFVYKIFDEIFGMKFYCILKYSPKSEKYSVFYRKGGVLNIGELVDCDKGLMPGVIDKTEILNSEDLKGHSLKVKKKKKNEELTKKEIELLVPLAVNGRIVGLMLLGRKRSDDVYNKSDVGLFGLVATQLASAIESSSLYEEINQLNKHLEVKVCEQTDKIVANAKELEKKNINLNKLLEVKNDFLRIVNHQLNTPVSIIKNSVYMIRSGSFTLEKGLSFIEDGTRQMEELFTNFWKAFSFEGEGMKINFQETNIEEIIGKLVENISNMPAVKSKNLAITIEKKGSLPKVKTDSKEITQVISNLLENAVTYTPAGGVNIYFEKKGKDYLKIFIKDSGNGIDKDEQKNLFEKFVRGARAIRSRPSGSGLGLYIAKKIVDASGGELKLESSEVDKGSTFSLTLPIWK